MAVVVSNVGRSRVPAVRDVVLVLVVGFLVLQQGLPRMGVLAQDASSPQANTALATGFTYQGRLILAGIPADGAFDFEFALFDQLNDGLPAGAPAVVTRNDIVVTNGLFSTKLDFGGAAFQGSERYVEVRVRPGTSNGTYETLTPRQELTPTPYALYAKGADWAGITNVPQALAIGAANCTNGQVWKRAGGTWQCAADEIGAAGTGDITSVIADAGLTGGALVGDASLAVDFGGNGSLNTVARSDHNHIGQNWTSSAFKTFLGLNNTATCLGIGDYCYGLLSDGGASTGGIGVRGNGGNTGVWGVSPIYGVYGTSSGTGGIGAVGEGETGVRAIGTFTGLNATGLNVGVNGASGGVGVQGTGSSVGVQGFGKKAVIGETVGYTSGCDAPGELFCYGLFGSSLGPAGVDYGGIGALGVGSYTGVQGTGDQRGVYGQSFTGNGTGVLGTGNTGVYGDGTAVGVLATSSAIGVQGSGKTAVFGTTFDRTTGCDTSGEGFCYGVYGTSAAPSGDGYGGIGVYGSGANTGVWGKGNLYGVYGDMVTGGIAAGYFNGPVFGTSFTAISDVRFKTNVASVPHGLADLMRFKTYSYDLVGQEDGRHLGLMAQDVWEIVPEVVREIVTPNGDTTLVMNYTELIPVLINAIQEQQAQIDALSKGPGRTDGEPRQAAVGGGSTGSSPWLFVLVPLALLAGAGWQYGNRAALGLLH